MSLFFFFNHSMIQHNICVSADIYIQTELFAYNSLLYSETHMTPMIYRYTISVCRK